MKYIFVLPSLLLLAACSSVGDAHMIGGRVDTVNDSNARITNMRTSVDNRLEVIDYAQKAGVISDSTSTTSSYNITQSRPSFSGPNYNREPNVRDPQSEKIGPLYEQALTAFKNMYKVHTDGLGGLSETEIKNAYLIAGGTEDPTELTNEQIKNFIDGNYASVLNKFFDLGTEPNTWVFEPKKESLTDVEMKIVSSDDVLTFTLDESGQIMEVRLADGGYVRTGNKSNTFWSKNATTGDETTIRLKASGNLKYSDYGRFSKAIKSAETDKTTTEYAFFAGGYDLKHIDRSKVALAAGEDSLDFKGTAMGIVRNSTKDEQMLVSGDATLNFMNGTETLNMLFSNDSQKKNWYDVQITDNGTTQTISFAPNSAVAEKYQLSDLNPSGNYDGMRVDYYGDRGNPTEYVGTATYTDTNGVSMDAAFGGSLVKPNAN